MHRVVLTVTAPLAFARRAVAAMLALSRPVNQVTPGAFFIPISPSIFALLWI